MDIEEAISSATCLSDGMVLVAKPPLTYASDARLVEMNPDGTVRREDLEGGYRVLLDFEDIATLLSYAARKKMSSRSVAEFIIHYAILDAYPAWFEDIPDI